MLHRAPGISPKPRFAAAIFAVAACLAGCMSAGSSNGPAADAPQDASGINALQEHPARHPGVPPGCTLEWGGAGQDSVLNCPDIQPPKPR